MSMSKTRVKSPRTILVIGNAGSGKGTQAKFIARALRPSYHLQLGKLVRRSIGKRTLAAQVIAITTTRGDLVPTWAILGLLARELEERVFPNVHIIGDGTPRRLAEAEFWDEVTRDARRSMPIALYLTLSEDEAKHRLLKRGRVDDTPAAIRRRFRYFVRDILPVIDYYRRRGRLITINGDQSVDAVWRDIKKALRLI